MNLTIRATYPATDGRAPEAIEVEYTDMTGAPAVLPHLTDHIAATINALAAVTADRVRPVVTLTGDDQTLTVVVGGTEVITTDHDEVGWAGLDKVQTLTRTLARQLGATLEDAR